MVTVVSGGLKPLQCLAADDIGQEVESVKTHVLANIFSIVMVRGLADFTSCAGYL